MGNNQSVLCGKCQDVGDSSDWNSSQLKKAKHNELGKSSFGGSVASMEKTLAKHTNNLSTQEIVDEKCQEQPKHLNHGQNKKSGIMAEWVTQTKEELQQTYGEEKRSKQFYPGMNLADGSGTSERSSVVCEI